MKKRDDGSVSDTIPGPTAFTNVDTDSLLRSDEPAEYGTFAKQGQGLMSDASLFLPVEQVSVPESAKRHAYTFVYCSHFLSAWGDRMWSFGVGLFLVRIAGSDLQLPATYGLASGLAIFLLGALVGDWVDSTPRLKAAQVSLVSQNLLVVVCAVGVYLYIRYDLVIVAVPGGWAVPLCYAGIITLAVVADLASMARVIAVERDWIVKICNTDTNMLAKMTATLRRIDQTTLIVAPIATGQVMTYAGIENGALFIGAWNLASVVLEYYLMWKVYTTVPALASKEDEGERTQKESREHKNSLMVSTDIETSLSYSGRHTAGLPYVPAYLPVETDYLLVTTGPEGAKTNKDQGPEGCRTDVVCSLVADTEILLDSDSSGHSAADRKPCLVTCCSRLLLQFIVLYQGWRTYMRYSVALAGLALACLYMTVLGFDNITVAYAVTQGVSESILGILMGVSAVFGMLGTFIYPALRRRVGLVRTGLMALTAQLACLLLCVLSVWMPGSPFDPTFSRAAQQVVNNSLAASTLSTAFSLTSTPVSPFTTQKENTTQMVFSTLTLNTSDYFTSTLTKDSTWENSRTDFSALHSTSEASTSTNNSSGGITTVPGVTSSHLTSTSTMNNGSGGTITTTVPEVNSSHSTSTSMNNSSGGTITTTLLGVNSSHSTSTSTMNNRSGGTITTTLPGINSSRSTTSALSFKSSTSSSLRANSVLSATASTSGQAHEEEEDFNNGNSETESGNSESKSGNLDTDSGNSGTALSSFTTVATSAADNSTELPPGDDEKSYVSVVFLMAGIVLARSGLWVADLAITQLFLEAVAEKERGVVNGVQNSLNKLMDVLKFALVVAVPDTETFGFLIIVSFAFIFLGWLMYAVFLRRERGHFFHCCWTSKPTFVNL